MVIVVDKEEEKVVVKKGESYEKRRTNEAARKVYTNHIIDHCHFFKMTTKHKTRNTKIKILEQFDSSSKQDPIRMGGRSRRGRQRLAGRICFFFFFLQALHVYTMRLHLSS